MSFNSWVVTASGLSSELESVYIVILVSIELSQYIGICVIKVDTNTEASLILV